MDKAFRYFFILAALLIVVVYFAGSTRLVAALGDTLVKVGYALTGRTSSGQFAAYPAGGPS
jgi:hypothetical protein